MGTARMKYLTAIVLLTVSLGLKAETVYVELSDEHIRYDKARNFAAWEAGLYRGIQIGKRQEKCTDEADSLLEVKGCLSNVINDIDEANAEFKSILYPEGRENEP